MWMMATAVDPSNLLGKKTRLGDFKTHTNLDAATCSVFPRSCCWAVEGSRCTGNVFFQPMPRKGFDVGDLQVFKVIPTSPKMKRRKGMGTAFVELRRLHIWFE